MHKKIFYFVILPMFIGIGCAPHITTSEHPSEIKKVYHASFDKTWDAVLEVVKISKGTVMIKEKSSGTIAYSINIPIGESGYQMRMINSVYLKNHPTSDTTAVYFFISRVGGEWSNLEKFLKEKEIDKFFFDKLDEVLGEK